MKCAKLAVSTAMAAILSLSAAGEGFAQPRHGGGGGGAHRGGGNMNHNMNMNHNVNRNGNFNHNTNVNRNANINRNTNVNRNVNANVNRNVNVNRNYTHWNGGYYGNYHGGWNRSYTWLPGGAIAAGAAIGFIAAGTAVAWAPPRALSGPVLVLHRRHAAERLLG